MIVDLIMDHTGLGISDIYKIVDTAPLRYRVYDIPKKSGGDREIAQPSRPLKSLQYVIIQYLNDLPVHDSAAAYCSGKSIFDNADYHKKSNYILKLDFQSFFNSLLVKDWDAYIRKNRISLSQEDQFVIRKLLFYGDGSRNPRFLSVGAPSSPLVSNLLMYDFDQAVSDICDENGVRYTRYADDITLSSKTSLSLKKTEENVKKLIRKSKSPRLSLNTKKEGRFSRAQRRMVTGLVITPDYKVSIGRERKRLISSMVHKIVIGSDRSPEHISKTKGYLSFANNCDPVFLSNLEKKYDKKILRSIINFEIPHPSSFDK